MTVDNVHLTAIVSEEHARKVLGYVELAKSEGAKVECGGKRVILPGSGSYYQVAGHITS